MKTIDARGELCPKPVILTKKALEEIETGKVETIVDNEVAKNNLSRLANSLGYEFVATDVSEKEFRVVITKLGEAKVQEQEAPVVMIGSHSMGSDEELGKILMKSLMYTISETKPYPKSILFYNTGVELCCEGSESLDDLQKLADAGVEIIACGTCLDFLKIKDKLKVGIIGNMYTIYETAISGKTLTIK
ncbi:MAG: sulfurtransferase-like selenium metabolism protein YedF [Tissierellia bacterium]|nr:sulfurtransferase-like selenium metabolism protein YedF [Tissierellia bacterium]